jgi:hypothetical protein
MMNDMARWTAQGVAVRTKPIDLRSGMAGAAGGFVMVLALAAGVAIAVVFAATLAVIMALATALLALSALAWRMRPRSVAQRAVVSSRRGGHAWVAYGWDQRDR